MKHSALMLATGLTALVISLPALAERDGKSEGSGTYTTGSGNTGTYKRDAQRSGNTVNSHQSITTEKGRTLDRSATTSYDKETGTTSRSVTSPSGKTRTSSGAYNSETKSFDSTTTGARGHTVDTSTTYDRETKTSSTTYTGENGRSTTTSTQTVPAGTETTGAQGGVWRKSNTVNKETGELTHSVTGPEGRTGSVVLNPD